tara:strand:- start:63 stop:191 length:129 start_codon:yes stop_codon:yes gene_type:complete
VLTINILEVVEVVLITAVAELVAVLGMVGVHVQEQVVAQKLS